MTIATSIGSSLASQRALIVASRVIPQEELEGYLRGKPIVIRRGRYEYEITRWRKDSYYPRLRSRSGVFRPRRDEYCVEAWTIDGYGPDLDRLVVLYLAVKYGSHRYLRAHANPVPASRY